MKLNTIQSVIFEDALNSILKEYENATLHGVDAVITSKNYNLFINNVTLEDGILSLKIDIANNS